MTTIRDIARLTGVSVSTVSLAFSSPHRVSRETLHRILTAAEAAGYVGDPVARSLANGKSRLLGMVVADISNPFFGRILKEVERHAAAAGYLVIISDSGSDLDRERRILEHLSAQRVAGILVQPSGHGREYGRYFSTLGMPVVCFDQKIEGVARDFVGTDNQLASAMLTEHLLQLGHRRIAFIAGRKGLFTTVERVEGFRRTMALAGETVEPSLLLDGRYEGEDAYVLAMRLLTRPDRPTAIIASNNVMALGALQAINDLGVKCPERISLTSIDEVPWSNVISPRLTASVQDTTLLGRLAADRLLARISDPAMRDAPGEDLLVAPQFRIGNSCAAPNLLNAVAAG